jgi:hypothetical protein
MPEVTAALLCNYLLIYPVKLAVLLTALALLLRAPVRSGWAWAVTGLGLACFFLTPVVEPPGGWDALFTWRSGRYLLEGVSPYRNPDCLQPPSALPLFVLQGALPFSQMLAVWTVGILLGTCALVVLTQRALACPAGEGWRLPPPVLGVFTAALALSAVSDHGLKAGQMALLTTLTILLALWARGRDRPGRAGLWLALGSVKAQTVLPFLLLFHRRRDRLAWLSLAAGCLGLYLLASPAATLFTRLGECLHNIDRVSAPGGPSDYAGANCFDTVGFNRTLYFLGVQDRAVNQTASLALLVALGTWAAWRCFGRRRWALAPAVSLVALASTLFVYHRFHDLLILVLPLVYVVGRARSEGGAARWWYVGAACSLLAVLNVRLETVRALSDAAAAGVALGWGEVLLVTNAFWLILLALACLEAGEWCRGLRAVPCALPKVNRPFRLAPGSKPEPAPVPAGAVPEAWVAPLS